MAAHSRSINPDGLPRGWRSSLPKSLVEIVEISSAGDQITDVPLSMMEGTGFFTSSIERALIAGEVDVAVHSFKDLPVEAADGLVVAAVPERAPVEDVLCARDGLSFSSAAAGRDHRHVQRQADRPGPRARAPIWTSARCGATCPRASAA